MTTPPETTPPRLVPSQPTKPWWERKLEAFDESDVGKRLRASAYARACTSGALGGWLGREYRTLLVLLVLLSVGSLLILVGALGAGALRDRNSIKLADLGEVPTTVSQPTHPLDYLFGLAGEVPPERGVTHLYTVVGVVLEHNPEAGYLIIRPDAHDVVLTFTQEEPRFYTMEGAPAEFPLPLARGTPVRVITTGRLIERDQGPRETLDARQVQVGTRPGDALEVPTY